MNTQRIVPDIRIIVSTIRSDERVQFGQVIMVQQADPKEVILVALDPQIGLYYWKSTSRKLKPHTLSQHRGYSRCIPPLFVDDLDEIVGDGYELLKEDIPEWDRIQNARTNTKNKLIRELFV